MLRITEKPSRKSCAQVYHVAKLRPHFGGIMSTVVLTEISWRERVRRAVLVSLAALGEMPFLGHLEELRQRIIKSVIALGVGTLIGVAYTAQIIEFLRRPAAIANVPLVAIESMEIFSLYFKVALTTGI